MYVYKLCIVIITESVLNFDTGDASDYQLLVNLIFNFEEKMTE